MATGVQFPTSSASYHKQSNMLDLKGPGMDQGYIPVVSHVITDEAVGSLQVIFCYGITLRYFYVLRTT